MTAYFGTSQKMEGEDDPWDFLDVALAIPDPLPLTETDTEDEAGSVKSAPPAPAAKPTGTAKCKPQVSLQKDLLDDLCGPKQAVHMYPASADTLKETRIPANLQVKCEQHTTGNMARFISASMTSVKRPLSGPRAQQGSTRTYAESTSES